jgi:hypothetical protein
LPTARNGWDDVEDHADAGGMGGIDEAPEVVGRAVQCEGANMSTPSVAPSEAPVELGNRHDLEDRSRRDRRAISIRRWRQSHVPAAW